MENTAAPTVKRYTKLRNPLARLRLVCLHHAAGCASMYLNWVSALPPSIELSVIELPGRGETLEETAFEDTHAAAEAVAQILEEDLQTPYVLFGHNLGALIGFEAIRLLEKKGKSVPKHFFPSGLGAPHKIISQRRNLLSNEELIHLVASYDQDRSDQRKLYYQMLETMLPTLRADFKMHDEYEFIPGELLSCPITACSGIEDEGHPQSAVQAWQDLTKISFSCEFFPGGAMYLFNDRPTFLHWLSEQLHFLINTR